MGISAVYEIMVPGTYGGPPLKSKSIARSQYCREHMGVILTLLKRITRVIYLNIYIKGFVLSDWRNNPQPKPLIIDTWNLESVNCIWRMHSVRTDLPRDVSETNIFGNIEHIFELFDLDEIWYTGKVLPNLIWKILFHPESGSDLFEIYIFIIWFKQNLVQ